MHEVLPTPGWYRPIWHLVHWYDPVSLENMPGKHFRQIEAPRVSEKVPSSQYKQLDAFEAD
jgi:hypothetical protein